MSKLHKPSILIVDDEDVIRELVSVDLAEAGFEVLEASSGDAALTLLETRLGGGGALDVLFTDIRMPGSLDGWSLGEQARRLAPSLKVAYASGHTLLPDRAVAGSIFLCKPYRTATLLESLSRLLA